MTKEKWTYLLMGIGGGIILSGILMVCIALEINHERRSLIANHEKELVALKTQLEMQKEMVRTDIIDSEVEKEDTQVQKDGAVASKQNYKWVDIPKHYGSSQIASFLEKEGIVANANDFHQYLIDQKQTKTLRTGQKFLPKLGEYETILAILLGKNNE
ncbi:MAG: hypothetical protein ACRCWY_03745 [Cellulosilyticaceae bacterium]